MSRVFSTKQIPSICLTYNGSTIQLGFLEFGLKWYQREIKTLALIGLGLLPTHDRLKIVVNHNLFYY